MRKMKMKVNSTNVGDIVNYYYSTPPKRVGKRKYYSSLKNIPYHELIFKTSYLKRYYPSSSEYTYSRTKGILVHSTIEYIVENELMNLHLLFSENVSYHRLWYHLKRKGYLSLLKVINSLEGSTPQIKIWFPFILKDCMKCLKQFLSQIFDICIERLHIGHNLENIISDIIPEHSECTNKLKYRDVIIYFKPDWVKYIFNNAIIVDYKTGSYYSWRIRKDRLQICLFAWLYSRKFNTKIERCEIHYIEEGKSEIIEFDKKLKKQIKKEIDTYIDENYVNMQKPKNIITINKKIFQGEYNSRKTIIRQLKLEIS